MMPWRCKCVRDKEIDDVTKWLDQDDREYKLFIKASKRAGVFADVEQQFVEAAAMVERDRSPSPDRERDMWACERCHSMNLRHDIFCKIAGCRRRRPLENYRPELGDWICETCGNHNYSSARWCRWSACSSNDWTCECGNTNRSNRRFCHRESCGRARPWDTRDK